MRKIFLSLFLLAVFSCFLTAAPSGAFDWEKSPDSAVLDAGIRHVFLRESSPRPMRINAVRVDLSEPFVFSTAGRDPDWGKPMPDKKDILIQTKRQTTLGFLLSSRERGRDMILAVNASPWSPWQRPFTFRFAGKMDFVVSDSVIVADRGRAVPAFWMTRDGKAHIGVIRPDLDRSGIVLALSGFEIILKGGVVCAANRSLHPRTCYGLSADGKFLYLLTVDGRQEGESEGASTIECAEYLKYFGASEALNMDGGGSTTLVFYSREKQKTQVLSRQSRGMLRGVANSLGISRR